MRTMVSVIALLLVSLQLSLAGDGKANIVGEWERVDGKSRFKFEADGTCTMTLFVIKGDKTGAVYKGKYRHAGKELDLMVGPTSARRKILTLTADRLVLEAEKNQEFKRTK